MDRYMMSFYVGKCEFFGLFQISYGNFGCLELFSSKRNTLQLFICYKTVRGCGISLPYLSEDITRILTREVQEGERGGEQKEQEGGRKENEEEEEEEKGGGEKTREKNLIRFEIFIPPFTLSDCDEPKFQQ